MKQKPMKKENASQSPNDPKLSDRSPEAPGESTAARGEGAACAGIGGGAHGVTEPDNLGAEPSVTERQGCGSLQRMVRRSVGFLLVRQLESGSCPDRLVMRLQIGEVKGHVVLTRETVKDIGAMCSAYLNGELAEYEEAGITSHEGL